ncbi:MAG: rhodanese-like domain-containing protein [Planctomycetota bacterium]
MILQQIYLGCLSQASYLIACEESRVAAIVDPRRDIDDYLELAKKHRLEIRHVVLTHFHADFVSGHIELRDRAGATIHLGPSAKAEYDYVPAREGSTIDLGPTVRLSFLETPGHTPESICVLVHDLVKDSKKPHAVLTGDTLFIGDVGRPDLMASKGVTADVLAGQLYDSLHKKLLALPDETVLYPGHGAGSLCGKSLSSDTVSTIGAQRKLNYALQSMAKESFVQLVAGAQGKPPSYFAYDAELNRKQRGTLDANLARVLKPLSLEAVLELQRKGAQVVDTRPPQEFEGEGHLVGSLTFGLTGKYASWAGALLSRERPIVLIATPGKESEAAVRLGRIGLDDVAGYLEGGAASFLSRPELVRRRERIEAPALSRELASKKRPTVIDVRGPGEWLAGHIEGSVNIPLDRLEERVAEIPRGERLIMQCQSGYRSAIAASILARHGIESANLAGGILAWNEAKLPVAAT